MGGCGSRTVGLSSGCGWGVAGAGLWPGFAPGWCRAWAGLGPGVVLWLPDAHLRRVQRVLDRRPPTGRINRLETGATVLEGIPHARPGACCAGRTEAQVSHWRQPIGNPTEPSLFIQASDAAQRSTMGEVHKGVRSASVWSRLREQACEHRSRRRPIHWNEHQGASERASLLSYQPCSMILVLAGPP